MSEQTPTQTPSTQNVDKEGFQEVSKPKRGHGPRPRRNALVEPTQDGEGRMTFRDLKYQLSLLQKRLHSPKVDLFDGHDAFIVKMEVPGLSLRELSIEIQNNQFLLVSGRKSDVNFGEGHHVYQECKYGNFMRRVKLPALVNSFNFKRDVSFENGVLTIKCEKKNVGVKQVQLDSSLDDVVDKNASWADL
jgi:HSP20 family molecular chaperone IbpA